tara:strand:- start:801 stop:1268 length:468 start_codon:yes stop_codon:yes gene_type:complete
MYSSSISVKFPGENVHKNLLEARALYDYYQKVFSSLGSVCSKSSFLFSHNGSTVHIKLSLVPLKQSSKKRFSVKSSPHVHQSQEQFLENNFLPTVFQITISSSCECENLVYSVEQSLSRILHSTDKPSFSDSKKDISIDHWFPTRSIVNVSHKRM